MNIKHALVISLLGCTVFVTGCEQKPPQKASNRYPTPTQSDIATLNSIDNMSPNSTEKNAADQAARTGTGDPNYKNSNSQPRPPVK